MSDYSASSLIAVTAVFTAFGVTTVALRFYSRFHQKAPLLIDDWLMLPALASFMAASCCVLFGVHIEAFGYSTFDFTAEQIRETLEPSAKAQIALNLSSVFCLGFVKGSVLFFYKRIFCVSDSKSILGIILTTSITVVACWVVTFELLLAFQCHTHFSAPWDGSQLNPNDYSLKYCDLSFPVLQGQAISDFLLDVWVLVLPICPILKLQAPKSRRCAIAAIFFLACIGIGFAIARMVIIIQLIHVRQTTIHNVDPQRYLSRIIFYFTLEMGVSLVAANLPSVFVVFKLALPGAVLKTLRRVALLVSQTSGRSRHQSKTGVLKSTTSTSSAVPMVGRDVGPYELGRVVQGLDPKTGVEV